MSKRKNKPIKGIYSRRAIKEKLASHEISAPSAPDVSLTLTEIKPLTSKNAFLQPYIECGMLTIDYAENTFTTRCGGKSDCGTLDQSPKMILSCIEQVWGKLLDESLA